MKLISDEALEKMLAVIDIYHGDDEEMRPIEKIDLAPTMESKYIRADLLWNKIAESAFFSAAEKGKIRAVIEEEPGEDVKPVVHAHWIAKCNPEELDSGTYCRCSNCGASAPIGFTFDWDFCPYCGAWMDEEKS